MRNDTQIHYSVIVDFFSCSDRAHIGDVSPAGRGKWSNLDRQNNIPNILKSPVS